MKLRLHRGSNIRLANLKTCRMIHVKCAYCYAMRVCCPSGLDSAVVHLMFVLSECCRLCCALLGACHSRKQMLQRYTRWQDESSMVAAITHVVERAIAVAMFSNVINMTCRQPVSDTAWLKVYQPIFLGKQQGLTT